MKCAACGEDHGDTGAPMFIHSKCHPGTGLNMSIDQQTDIVSVFCRACKALVVEFRAQAIRGPASQETTH